ncbi:MAG: helix-turn-helix transcriptional regulator [Betaproteobacteria bacterium]|nr:helix-turn-helix transcriptional regulator [Betaproteobacteria bacterium]
MAIIVDFGIFKNRLYLSKMIPIPLHSDDYSALVSLLRTARKEAGLTQVELATRLGVEQSLISKIERRERRLDVAELRIFCAALGIGLSEFVSKFEATLEGHTEETSNDW